MAKIQSKSMTALEIQNGQSVMNPNTQTTYHNVMVRPCIDDNTLILIQDHNGDSTILGASSLVWLMEEIS